jgi:hypothetical protein
VELDSGESGGRRRIGLVAHDHNKLDLLDWAGYNRELLSRHGLIATVTTGDPLMSKRCCGSRSCGTSRSHATARPADFLISSPLLAAA